MAYIFKNNPIASAKVSNQLNDLEMSLSNINGSASADTIVSAIEGFLYIGSRELDFEPTDITRTVKQNVDTE